MARLKLNRIATRTGVNAIDVDKLATLNGRYVRNIQIETNTTTYNFSTAWAQGPLFDPFAGVPLKAGSLVRLFYHMPCRNDYTGWGGGYIEPQFRINGGAWITLGSSGYDAGVMHSSAATGNANSIGSYNNTLIIDPNQAADFTIDFRFMLRSYEGTLILNGSHDINNTSATGTWAHTALTIPDKYVWQHFASVRAEELATLA